MCHHSIFRSQNISYLIKLNWKERYSNLPDTAGFSGQNTRQPEARGFWTEMACKVDWMLLYKKYRFFEPLSIFEMLQLFNCNPLDVLQYTVQPVYWFGGLFPGMHVILKCSAEQGASRRSVCIHCTVLYSVQTGNSIVVSDTPTMTLTLGFVTRQCHCSHPCFLCVRIHTMYCSINLCLT